MKIIKLTLTALTTFFAVIVNGQNTTRNFSLIDGTKLLKEEAKCLGKQFGSFHITTSDSTTFSNADFTNKVVFVNFWFEGCTPCIAEMEGLNKLYDSLKNKKDFLFASFTFDPDSTIKKIKNKYHIKYNIFHLSEEECHRLNFKFGFPASFVLDRKGTVTYYKFGGKMDKDQSTTEVLTQIYPEIIKQL